jgi:hypothetical protein
MPQAQTNLEDGYTTPTYSSVRRQKRKRCNNINKRNYFPKTLAKRLIHLKQKHADDLKGLQISKHSIFGPVYDKYQIFYPIRTLSQVPIINTNNMKPLHLIRCSITVPAKTHFRDVISINKTMMDELNHYIHETLFLDVPFELKEVAYNLNDPDPKHKRKLYKFGIIPNINIHYQINNWFNKADNTPLQNVQINYIIKPSTLLQKILFHYSFQYLMIMSTRDINQKINYPMKFQFFNNHKQKNIIISYFNKHCYQHFIF